MKLFDTKKTDDNAHDTPSQIQTDEEIIARVEEQHRSNEGIGKFMRHPVQVLTEKPMNVLILTIPVAIIVFVIGLILQVSKYGVFLALTTTGIDDYFLLAVLIASIPLAILDLKYSMRVRNLNISLPNFFRDVAGMNESGMTLPNAIHVVAEGEYGSLTKYIQKLDAEMSWNIPFVDAIYQFGERIGTSLAQRSVDLIAKASRAGGDVSEVLRAAANDSFEFVNLETERRNNMLIYVIIVLISYLVFLFVIAVMTGTFLETMAQAGGAVSESGSGGTTFGGAIDMDFYRRLFLHASVIQGFFSGLVAGQMGEGRAVAGLKYSVIMVVIGWVAFRLFI
ncbi:type II secretion system F family protein [Methanogenium marinum]|uniref:Type II secretion system F family protein n=1 Tax=Methanogenium marinum TaxID=348610 RepID=A0A9Q4KUG3_9EURY|nr:type II secretion system F family protein [Methanogenium marinum]MDE4909062.1 type II secretion system F family protein [Methanogenium marinum]